MLVLFSAWCRACNFISVHCALCTLFCVQCKAYAQSTSCIGKSLYVQFTRRNALHCAGCSVFLGPVYFVHQLRSVFQSVCNVRATSKVCDAKCARCALCKCRAVRCAQCVLVTSLLCAQALHRTHTVCNVHTTCKVCNATCARCALCKCRAIRCVQNVSVPRLLCTQALLSTQTVCNVRAARKVCIAQYAQCALCKCRVHFAVCRVFQCTGCLVHKLCLVPHPCAMPVYLVGCAMLGVHSENSPRPKCKLLLNAHAHSHPPTSCAQCVLCTLCVLYPPAMGPAVAPRSRRSPAKCAVIV